MASLTETAYYTRKGINWGILMVLLYFLLRLLWVFFVAFWLLLFPPRPIPPNHAFGKLPRLSFPAPESSPSGQLTLSLETITGSLPDASNSARVYFMPKVSAELLAINKAQDFAQQAQFDITPIQETRTIYRFNDPQFPLRKLRYDIVSKNFILRYGFEQDTGLFTQGTLRDPDRISLEAVKILESYNLYSLDLQNGTSQVSYLKLVGDTLVPVTNLSEADAMRVDFFRGSISTFSLVTPHPGEGQVQILFSGSTVPQKHVLQLIYTEWPVDGQTFATYPLKPMGTAWTELQNGGGYIASYPNNGTMQAIVRNGYLAYYDSYDPQTYLQPIYVFTGDHGFVGYVSAISPEWTE